MTCFENDDLELSLLSINSSSSSPLTTKLIVDEFIRKPFSIENLIMLINKHNIMMNRTKGPIVPPMAFVLQAHQDISERKNIDANEAHILCYC
jgi:hypothetical protein